MRMMELSRSLGEHSNVGWTSTETEGVVKSAGRVIRILELFDVLRREAPAYQVSELLDLPQSSTSVLLRSMVVMGYLQFNPKTRAFKPTTRVALLSNWVNGAMIRDGLLMRLLQRINARTNQAVVVAVRNQIWSECIHVVQSTSTVRPFVVKGSRRPLIRSGTGLILLADLSDTDIKRIAIRTNAEAEADQPRRCIQSLMDQITEVRRQGWAATFDTITQGTGMIAMQLPQLDSEEQLVLGLPGLTENLRANLDTYLNVLREETARFIEWRQSHETMDGEEYPERTTLRL
ncbi:DNA-binding IclR family transcriptional regulator [Sphingobium sp. OAS761]|uniref:IclR family transcriptional regulator n=1 Tax=Sphingobium sp. OAS761 TaxID=2817901 RepID=UPI0020A12D46|nr:helix-turn-helix domain-containing protein [Sphingobium sp. OAS761]MCP1472398.1 DNA-binding IclR family transcriptional regulator [Sphingobium sp. OAS761]